MLFIVDYTGIMKKRQERVGKRKRSNRKRSKRNPEFSEKAIKKYKDYKGEKHYENQKSGK